MRILSSLIITLLISCNSKINFSNTQGNPDSLINSILGKWGGPGEDSPVFEIRRDSIYYFQQATAYSYKILNHDMIIDLPDSKGVLGNIYAIQDTLFTLNDGILIKAIKFK